MLFTLFRPVYTTTLPERDLYIVLGPTDLLPDILRTKDRDIQIQELQKKGGMYNFETSQNIKILCLLAPENQSEKVAEQARSLEVNTTLYIGESLDRAEIVEAFGLGVYKFEKFLSEPKNLSHAIHGVPTEREEQAHLRIQAIYGARDLVNLPPNEKYPEALTSLIQGLSWSSRTKLRVLDQAAMKKEGMGMIIGVGQ